MKQLATAILILVSTYSYAQLPLPANANDISPLLIGEQVPDATLTNTDNKQVQLHDVISRKPTVLLFYRGGWCPYCNAHLGKIAEIEQDILDAGYQVVAVSPDEPERLMMTADKKTIKYTLLSDGDGSLVRAMGIAFKAPENKWKTNQLQKHSGGKNTGFLPVPSVFVLDKNGNILFEYIAPDYTHRIDGTLLMAVLKALT